MRTTLLSLLLLSACGPDTKAGGDTGPVGTDGDTDTDSDSDTDADTDTDTDTDCTATVAAMAPADLASDVAIDTSVVATFTAAVSAANIKVSHGVTGSTVVADDGMSATFTPDAPLDRDTTYTATTTVCGADTYTSFTTVSDAVNVDLTEHTYDIELDDDSDLTWVKPALGAYLAGNIATTSILFMVQSADSAQIDLVGAAGYVRGGATEQYPCTYAIDFPASSFTSNPGFGAGPTDAEMDANGVVFDLFDLTIAGTFARDGTAATGVVLTGLLDTRPIGASMGVDACAFAASFGDTCITCPDGAVGCLEVEIHDGTSPLREGLVLDPAQDPTTDLSCAH